MTFRARVQRLLLTLLMLTGAVGTAGAEIVLSAPVLKDVAHTVGFHIGQRQSLQRIASEYPALARAADVAGKSFSAAFGDSLAEIDARMARLDKAQWQRIKTRITHDISATASTQAISRAEAERFIEEVHARAKADLPSPVIETLLMFKPRYQRRPVAEFAEGYRQRYRNDGSGKAKGVAFDLQAPKSWAISDGNRPNIVTKIVSEKGRGLELFLVLIKEIPADPSGPVTAADIEEMLDPETIRGMLPEGSTYLASGKYTLETLPGYWVRFDLKGMRGRQTFNMSTIMYSVFYKNRLIQMQGQVAASDGNSSDSSDRFDRFEPLFDQIAQSLVLPAIYGQGRPGGSEQ